MTDQSLDLRRSLYILRRRLSWIGIVMAAGLLAGIGYALFNPSMLTSSTLVALPTSTPHPATQVVIASSEPVLAIAGHRVSPALSPKALLGRVQVTSMTPYLLLISAKGRTSAQAESTAKAIADSYVAYLSSPDNPNGLIYARILEGPTYATGMRFPLDLFVAGGVGVLSGALVGAIIVLAVGRKDRRLQERDQIADAIGIPVLASVPVRRPTDPASWSGLLRDYKPGAADTWQFRNALRHLKLIDVDATDSDSRGASLTVLSLSSDRRALALGPQLASFTAGLGISTALVGPQDDAHTTEALQAACAAPLDTSRKSDQLRVVAADHYSPYRPQDAALTVVVAVVSGQAPRIADLIRTTAIVLGVSAGGVTPEDLARVVASAAADGRRLGGILIADPNPTDETTGRLPQLARPVQKITPKRMTGIVARG